MREVQVKGHSLAPEAGASTVDWESSEGSSCFQLQSMFYVVQDAVWGPC